MCQDEAHIELNIVFMKKGFLTILTFASVCIFNASASAANLTLYTDYNAWLAAVNASSQNLETSTFETNYTNVSNEEYISPFSQLPATSDPDYLTTRTDISFDGNNVNLGRHATFDTDNTGFDISFEISATQSASGRGDARIYYNDILQGKTPVQVDSFTDVLSIGKFNGFDSGDGSEFDWDDDDFTLEITSNDQVYGIAFDLHNNKQNISEWLEIYANKTDAQSLIKFDQGAIPGYTGSYDSNFDDVRFIGVVSDTPFTWLEFNEGNGVNDIGLANIRFATPQLILERLLINSTGSGSGSFSINPAGIDCGTSSIICMDYTAGTSVTVTATPTTGDSFTSWSGCDSTSGQSCTVSMTSAKTITALFEEILDTDNDGTPDSSDNCPTIANPNQTNSDGDSAGNLCDAFSNDSSETKDSDNDGMGDNFEDTFNLNKLDSSDASLDPDADNYTNLQEFLSGTNPVDSNSNPEPDSDSDGHKDSVDNCPAIANPNQTNSDGDSAGNLCDAFPNDSSETKDSDNDGMGDNFETTYGLNSANGSDASQDLDGDGLTNLAEFQGNSDPSNVNDPNNHLAVFWRNSETGDNNIYLMDGNEIIQNKLINVVPAPWQIAGIADFNGDNEQDILWRNSETGDNWIYLINNSQISESVYLNTVSDNQWKIVGTGDFDGDGKDDILWHHSLYGQVYVYLMDGTTITSSLYITSIGSEWEAKGTDDFNGDGKSDILWRNKNYGSVWMYIMDGATILNSEHIVTTGLDWNISETGDFNGDGKSDILWRYNPTGVNWVYLMNGTQITQSSQLNIVADLDWEVVQTDDFNNDGKTDLFWRHSKTGTNWMYLLNGSSISDSQPVNQVPDTNWRVVPTLD